MQGKLLCKNKEAFDLALQAKLEQLGNAATFSSVEYLKKEKGTKTRPDNYIWSYVFGIAGFIYLNKLKRGLEDIKQIDEGFYDELKDKIENPKPRAWGHHLDTRAIIEHNGKHYLELNVKKSRRIAGHSVMPKTEKEKENIEKSKLTEMMLRDYAFDNIIKINLGKIQIVNLENLEFAKKWFNIKEE